MKKYIYSLIIFITISGSCMAQRPGTLAVPFLLYNPSPGLGAYYAGNAVCATDDPYGFYYNPAQLAVFSRDNNFAFQFYPVKTKWVPGYQFTDWTINNTVFTAGYNYKNFYNDIDLDIGIGYMRNFLNLGENIVLDDRIPKIHAFESCDAYAIGFGFEYYARFAIGFTYKKITSNLGYPAIIIGNELTNNRADGSAYDFGIHVGFPIIKAGSCLSFEGLNLFSDIYLGFAVVNMGDFIKYADSPQSDPLPKKERLGLGFSIGFIKNFGVYDIKPIELEFASEANDILVKSSGDKETYQSAFASDINIWNNILLGKANNFVQVQKSINVNIFESIYFGLYKTKGWNFNNYIQSTSFSISTAGLFKILGNNDYNDFLNFLLNHTDLGYSQCKIEFKDSPVDGTIYKSIAIHLKKLF